MKKYIYSIVAATALFASCSQDAELNEIGNTDSKAITTIGASTENSSRAVVSSADNKKVNWEEEDQLGVFGTNSSSEAKNLAYTLNSGSGTTSGMFENGSSEITTISAIMYPYQESATFADSKLTCEIPYVQTATKGSFDKAAAIMYSIGNTTDAKLNYAVNFLKVTVSESETNVHAISISSTTTALSGKMEITSESVTAASSGSLNSVVLTAGKGKVLAAGDYYIAVKAGNIENPTISYVYYNNDHTATEKSKAGSGTLSFAEGTNVKPISVNFTTGTVSNRNAIQLWADGPYFADRNLGASGPTDGGANYKFSETGPDDAAAKTWGVNWRVPTKEQVRYLDVYYGKIQYSSSIPPNPSGIYLYGKADDYSKNSVFFPCSYDTYQMPHGGFQTSLIGIYFSGTPPYQQYLPIIDFYDSDDNVGNYYLRLDVEDQYGRFYVRPVLAE